MSISHRFIRAAAVALAAAFTSIALASPAQAHEVRVDGPRGFVFLSSDHTEVTICNYDYGPVWATLRHRDGSLRRYDGLRTPGVCGSHAVGGEPTAIRYCHGVTPDTWCTPFKPA